jgi:TonB-linked SusC/RagA family outer membrane protein
VVVTAAGIERERRALGYSVENVQGESVQQVAEPDAMRALHGKVPGVNIIGSAGTPGSATRITVRGNSSFFGNNMPLVIIDGVPYHTTQYTTSNQLTSGAIYANALSTLDPNNIESMNVLKGAAAAALYGSRAAHGVIIVTTKTGSARPSRKGMEVTLNSSYILEEIANLPDYQNTYGAGVEFQYANANGSWGPNFSDLDMIPTWPTYRNILGVDSIPYVARPNNVRNLFDVGNVFETSIAVEGGSERSVVSAIASIMQQDGYIPFTSFDRTNLSIGGLTTLENGIHLRGNLSFTNTNQRGPLAGESLAADPGAASSFARTLWMARDWNTDLPYEDPVTGGPLFFVGTQADHPLWSWRYNGLTADVDRIVTSMEIGYDFNEWLSTSYQIGMNIYNDRRQQKYELGSRAYSGEGALIEENINFRELESLFLVSFDRDLITDFNLKATLGHNINQRTGDSKSFFGRGIITRGIDNMDNLLDVISNGAHYSRRRLVGVFGDLSFSYRNYLFLNLTGRNDWSSTLPVENRSFFYPSVSSSFVFTDALNVSGRVLSFGKIRAGFARVGNDADPYQLVNIYRVNFGSNTGLVGAVRDIDLPFLGQPGMTVNSTAFDPNLTPEFTSEIELGTSLEFYRNRVGLDFTWYNKISTDLIANISLPASSGYSFLVTNFGKLRNRGVEVGLNLTPIEVDNGFRWNIYTVFTRNRNIVEELLPGVERINVRNLFGGGITPVLEPGEPYGILRGSVPARDDEGNLLINQVTGTMIEALDHEKVGDPNPHYVFGFNNSFSFRGLFLNAVVDFKKGGDLYSTSIYSLLGRGVTKHNEDREAPRIIPGVYGDPNTLEPLLDEGGNKIPNRTMMTENNLWFGNTFAINTMDYWNVYDATVIRLREVTLGYRLPANLIERLPFGSASISFTGRNLWFRAPNMPKHLNFDPEIGGFGSDNTQGIEYTTAPSSKRYGVNLRFSF